MFDRFFLDIEKKFEIDNFLEVIKEYSGVDHAVIDEFNGVGLALKNGSFFCFQCEGEAVVMLFLTILPIAMTDNELENIDALSRLGEEDFSGRVVQMEGCRLVCCNVIEKSELCIEVLPELLHGLVERWKRILVAVKIS